MGHNILVVDDSPIIRAAFRKTLGMAGVEGEIFEAANGREALDQLDSNWIDLVLADINMPVMTGIELVDAMAENGMLETTPVIMVSTERSELRIQELKAKGVSDYLNKPFTPEDLRDAIDQALASG